MPQPSRWGFNTFETMEKKIELSYDARESLQDIMRILSKWCAPEINEAKEKLLQLLRDDEKGMRKINVPYFSGLGEWLDERKVVWGKIDDKSGFVEILYRDANFLVELTNQLTEFINQKGYTTWH